MIDGFKAKGKNVNSTDIVDNRSLSFVTKNVSDDGILFKSNKLDNQGKPIYRTPYRKAEYKGLSVIYSENGNFRISGSIHKYYNDGLHNYNDFREAESKVTFLKLCNEFGIDPNIFILENIEIGINFSPPIATNDILDMCFFHGTKPFALKHNDKFGKYIECQHSQYSIKIYNKALQYRSMGFEIDKEIIRFEVKFTVMERLNKLGVITVSDLLSLDFSKFKSMLLKEWDKVFFFDKSVMYLEGFNQQYASEIYWKDLLKRESHSAYYKHKRKLKEFTLKNSDNLKDKVKEVMANKIDFLISKGTRFERLPIISIPVPLNN